MKTKRVNKGPRGTLIRNGYAEFLGELKSRIQSARLSAARAVNSDLILLYWDIGREIMERKAETQWGQSVIERLARDLQKAFPGIGGFSPRNLRDMQRFYVEYSTEAFWRQAVAKLGEPPRLPEPNPIWRQAVAKLPRAEWNSAAHADFLETLRLLIAEVPWGQHLHILNKTDDAVARLYYLQATAQFGWSRSVLLNQIKARAYERAKLEKKTHNFALALPEHLAEQAQEMIKSSYSLEFLGIARATKERELEDRLIDQLRDFILELGYGFCFVGRQHRLAIRKKEYFVDLLFYHRFLRSLVAIDLKLGSFEPEHSGKMDFYLNVLNDTERAPGDNPSVGIILCAEKDDVEIEYALKTKANPIGVAEYQLQSKLPAEFKGKLPTAKQLIEVIRMGMPAEREKPSDSPRLLRSHSRRES